MFRKGLGSTFKHNKQNCSDATKETNLIVYHMIMKVQGKDNLDNATNLKLFIYNNFESSQINVNFEIKAWVQCPVMR